jgi:hypothetical protein
LFETSKGVAAGAAEVVGGILGASLLAALDIALMPLTRVSVATLPFVALVGLCAGIFCARGRRGIRGDRQRRESDLDRQAQLRAAEDYMGLLTKAVKKGLLKKEQAQERAEALFAKALSAAPGMTMLPAVDQIPLGPADKSVEVAPKNQPFPMDKISP